MDRDTENCNPDFGVVVDTSLGDRRLWSETGGAITLDLHIRPRDAERLSVWLAEHRANFSGTDWFRGMDEALAAGDTSRAFAIAAAESSRQLEHASHAALREGPQVSFEPHPYSWDSPAERPGVPAEVAGNGGTEVSVQPTDQGPTTRLNQRQKWVVFAGLVVFLAMGLIPPWVYKLENGTILGDAPRPYVLVFTAPEPYRDALGATVDWARLAVQWTVVAVGTAVLALLLEGAPRQRSDRR